MPFPYDTLLDKDPTLVVAELDQICAAGDVTVAKGIGWLSGRTAPHGDLLRAPEIAIHSKLAWLLSIAGRDDDLARLLDWLTEQALRDTGDVCFAADPPSFRLYRQAYVLRAAERSGHPLATAANVRERMLQYQDAGGGVFDSIGDDPARPQPPAAPSLSATCNFGHYAIQSGQRAAARAAGAWVARLVEQNEPHMAHGRFYPVVNADGTLHTQLAAGEELDSVVDAGATAMQTTWRLGIAMGFLAELYGACRDWDADDDAERLRRAALALLDLQDRMPLETYFNLNACKVAWGAGRLLDVLLQHDAGDALVYDKLYRAGRRTYLHTFLATKRADGSWTHDFYPLDSRAPEMAIDVRTMEGISALPEPAWRAERNGSAVVGELETTAEHAAWIVHLLEGMRRLRDRLRAGTLPLTAPAA
jgi:hypothetical protein